MVSPRGRDSGAIAECATLTESAEFSDKAAGLAHYARAGKDPELEAYAARIRAWSERRLGEISKKLEKSPGGRPPETLSTGEKSFAPSPSKGEALKDANISVARAHRAEKLAAIPVEEFTARVEKAKPDTLKALAESKPRPWAGAGNRPRLPVPDHGHRARARDPGR